MSYLFLPSWALFHSRKLSKAQLWGKGESALIIYVSYICHHASSHWWLWGPCPSIRPADSSTRKFSCNISSKVFIYIKTIVLSDLYFKWNNTYFLLFSLLALALIDFNKCKILVILWRRNPEHIIKSSLGAQVIKNTSFALIHFLWKDIFSQAPTSILLKLLFPWHTTFILVFLACLLRKWN